MVDEYLLLIDQPLNQDHHYKVINYMSKKKSSELHHWWPKCVSKHWENEDGIVTWVKPNGEEVPSPSKSFGGYTNGHYAKLSPNAGETTPWDQNFEDTFNKADNGFPDVITWLKSLRYENNTSINNLTERFVAVEALEDKLAQLVESIVSLAIRSPIQRETTKKRAEDFRGINISKREVDALTALNMRHSQEKAVSLINTRGKFVIIHSPNREFIFGDGFFHNVVCPVDFQLHHHKVLAPITPEISVLHVIPQSYMAEPKLFTLTITPEETDALNNAVQAYAKNNIFYRSEKPQIIESYQQGQHLQYSSTNNPINTLIKAIPGIKSRATHSFMR